MSIVSLVVPVLFVKTVSDSIAGGSPQSFPVIAVGLCTMSQCCVSDGCKWVDGGWARLKVDTARSKSWGNKCPRRIKK